MRYLAGSAINFSVWTPEPCATNIFVRAPPQATVARLLQYVHWQLSQRSETPLLPTEEYWLLLDGQPLALSTTLQTVSAHSGGVIKLKMQLHDGNLKEPSTNLGYHGELEFAETNVEFQLNVLSTDKLMSRLERGVSLNSTLAKLKKAATKHLNDYESHNVRNLCSIKQHTVQDLVGFDILGRLHPTYLTTDDSNNDLRLYDLLGFDFPPEKSGSCCVMFRTRHDQELEDGISVRFVSEASLTMDRMVVSTDTTVHEMKEFICTVYGHTLRLTPADVRLVYKGQLLQDANSVGQPSKVLEYISESRGAKVHVFINQEYTEPGPGFWNELFNSSERFTFMSRSASENVSVSAEEPRRTASEPNRPTGLLTVQPPNAAHASDNPSQLPNATVSAVNQSTPVRYDFFTESGYRIERTGERYEKVLIAGVEHFIHPNAFEPALSIVEVAGIEIELLPDEVFLSGDSLALSPQAVKRIEDQIGVKLAHAVPLNLEPTPTLNSSDRNEGEAIIVPETRRMARIRRWVKTIMRTVYLLLRNSFFYLAVFFQLVSFLPSFYFFVGIALIVLWTIWSTTEIWDMWRELLWGGQVEKLSEEEQAVLREILNTKPFEKQFYTRFVGNQAVTDVLVDRLQNDLELREKLAQEFQLEHTESLQISVPKLLESCKATQFDQAGPESLTELFEPILSEVEGHLDDTAALSGAGKEFLKQLRVYAYQQSKLPWYKGAIRWVSHKSSTLYNGALVEWLMPERIPRARRGAGIRQALHIVWDLLKLSCLFVLIVLPKFQIQAVDMAGRIATDEEHQD
ncbi:LAQU0S11e04324g1_1 [Lachancea quebecensis]|uniref:LAQU0S11e04324g1_1 n=1 Tax=Lachancea quebecensis TaxID=1654605 RepID=A0A0P1L174_9SACH|nr:LAQU0S11e04324g1_1 [Lachancea quebecensis]